LGAFQADGFWGEIKNFSVNRKYKRHEHREGFRRDEHSRRTKGKKQEKKKE